MLPSRFYHTLPTTISVPIKHTKVSISLLLCEPNFHTIAPAWTAKMHGIHFAISLLLVLPSFVTASRYTVFLGASRRCIFSLDKDNSGHLKVNITAVGFPKSVCKMTYTPPNATTPTESTGDEYEYKGEYEYEYQETLLNFNETDFENSTLTNKTQISIGTILYNHKWHLVAVIIPLITLIILAVVGSWYAMELIVSEDREAADPEVPTYFTITPRVTTSPRVTTV